MMSATPPEDEGRPPPDGSDQPFVGSSPPGGQHDVHQHPEPRRPGRRAKLVPGAIGVVAGLVVGVFAGSVFADGNVRLTAAGDAATTCEYVAAVSADFDPEQIRLDDPTLWRLQAVAALAQAAPITDPAYRELGDQGKELMAAISRVEVEQLESSLEAMDQTCGRL